jgi:hypothetical protein
MAQKIIGAQNANWKPIARAHRDAGPLLLREGSDCAAFVGAQADDGRWYVGRMEVQPTHFCTILPFDCDDAERPGFGNHIHMNTSLN